MFVTLIWVNMGSGNGVLPEGAQPLPKPMFIYHHTGVLSQSPDGTFTRNDYEINP